MRPATNVYSLPELMMTRDGQIFYPRDGRWPLNSQTQSYNFTFDDHFYGSHLVELFKGFILTLIQSKKMGYAFSAYQSMKRLISHIASYEGEADSIKDIHLVNYRSSLDNTKLYNITGCLNYLKKWKQVGVPGVSTEALRLAAEMPKHHRKKGLAVKLLCPKTGAYSNLEFDGLYKALHNGFATGEVSLSNYAIGLLSGSLAVRPIQAAMLMVSDFRVEASDGAKKYSLSVPRAKQNKGGYRTHFTERPLTEEIGLIVEAQVRSVMDHAALAGLSDRSVIPLFPSTRSDATFFESKDVPTVPTSTSIGQNIVGTFKRLDVKSERTGTTIVVNATRARRTLGTRSAQAGKSLEEIAFILDHTSLDSAQCYVEIGSELMPNIDKKMALYLAPMAQRFAGTISVKRSGEEGIDKQIFGEVDLGGAPANIGGCGKYGFCGLGKPTACYTCRLFRPWADAPHEAILDSLLERRDRVAASGSQMVASALEDTIVACAEVVRQCRLLAAEV